MAFTIPDILASSLPARLALFVLAGLALVSVPTLGDPIQAPRAVVGAIAVIVLLAAPGSSKRASRVPIPAIAIAAALLAWLLLSAVLNQPASSLWGVHGRFQGLASACVLACSAVAGAVTARRHLGDFAVAVSIVSLAISAIVMFQLATGGGATGTFGNSAIAGSWLAVAAGICGAGALSLKPGPARWLMIVAAAVSSAAAAAVGSRTAVLAILFGAAVLLAATRAQASSKRIIAVSLVILALIVGTAFGGASVLQKFMPQALTSGSAASRLHIWRSTATMVAASPVTGVGPGRFLYEFPAYQSIEHARAEAPDTRADQAHSYLLQYAAEAGAPAALLFVALLALALSRAWAGTMRKDASALIALGGLSVWAVHSMFGVASVETDVLGWFLMGVALVSQAASDGARPAQVSDSRRAGVLVATALALSGVAFIAISWYLVANAHHGRALDRFAAGDFAIAQSESVAASRKDPLTDIYRVGLADTASYLLGDSVAPALDSLDRGLGLEPRSYDLALSRARLLAVSGAPAEQVREAYHDALALYPQGVTVRAEAAAHGVSTP